MQNTYQLLELPAPVIEPGPHRQFHMGACVYCGRHMMRLSCKIHRLEKYSRDHVIPRSRNRKSRFTVPCCFECNIKKGNRNPTEQELLKAIIWGLCYHGR